MKKTLLAIFFTHCTIFLSLSQTATLTPILELDGAAITSVSENGKWACGSAFNNNDGAGYQSNASKWNLETGERIYLVPEEDLDAAQSDAFAITNDGSLVTGQYLLQPAYYVNGKWHTLELPKGYTIGEARDVAIIGTDTIIVGRIFDSTGYQKVQSAKWVNGKFESFSNIIPQEYLYNEDNKMANQITGISEDGRILLGAYDPFAWPLRKPFIIKDNEFILLDIDTIPEFAKYHANVDFFKEEKLNHNGRYIALSFYGHNTHIPVVYDVTNNKFTIIDEAPFETSTKAVDNNGNAYYAGPATTGYDRKSYVTIEGTAVHIDNILRAKFGITQEQINATCADPDLTGSIRYIYDVASDGKTIIGSAGFGTGGYNWVLKLSHTLFEVGYNPLTDAVENITYNNSIAYYTNGYINIVGTANYFEIYNINGQLVETKTSPSNINPTSLAQGIYIIKLYNNNQISTNKIIIK